MARVLVIEDNRENLELMTYLLRIFGHETLTAPDGVDGLEVAQRDRVDLIACDIHLPRMDGYEVARRVKIDPKLRGIPLVAVTALAMVGDRDKVLAAGFDGYIPKPIVPQEFVKQLEAFLPASLKSGSLPAPAHAAAREQPAAATGARILVVDDSPVNCDVIESTLAPSGYRVTLATNVAEARAILVRESFDLILSDLHMPNEDGYQFFRTVKADPCLRSIPFMFITSSVWGERERARALEQGASRFALRPIEPTQLLELVAACIKNREV